MPLNTKYQTCLAASNIWFSYGNESILEDVSLQIGQGESVGIAGPNGAGKTTLLKILVGLLEPQKGKVKFSCQQDECAGLSPCRPCIGYVPQQPLLREQQFPVTVREVVEMGRFSQLGAFQSPTPVDVREVDKAIREAGLSAVEGELFGDLSGGQQQRVLVARALAGHPHVLALDEPTSGVDAHGKKEFYKLLEHMHTVHRMTIVIVLHDLPDLTKRAERVVFLKRRVLYDGPSRKLGVKGLWNLMVRASEIS